MMEIFDPPETTGPMEQKLDVIAAHSATALYNAAEMKRVPLKPLWWPLMRMQQGLGGKARFWTFFTIAALVLLTVALTVIPYPLKLDANGKLAPLDAYYVYPPQDGQVIEFTVNPNDEISPGAPVAIMKRNEWVKEIMNLKNDLRGLNDTVQALSRNIEGLPPETRDQRQRELIKARSDRDKVDRQLRSYQDVYRCDLRPGREGFFEVTAPLVRPSHGVKPTWMVLTQDFREQLTNKTVQPRDPLLRVGNVTGGWEVILKIPQKHVGKMRKAFAEAAQEDSRGKFLWVDVLVTSAPTPGYQGRGKMYLRDLTAMAEPNKDDQNESEPVVIAYVRINTPDIAKENPDYLLDPKLLLTDQEVRARIRGGDHSMGYSLFYGVWEFLYEKVIFFF